MIILKPLRVLDFSLYWAKPKYSKWPTRVGHFEQSRERV